MRLNRLTSAFVHSQPDVITFPKIATRLPPLLKKLPHVIKGLILANDTRPKKPMGLGWAFEKAVKQNPYGPAILYLDRSYSYAQMNEWANQIAHCLLARGLKKGDVIAVILENRPELMAVSIAVAKIGVTAALVNTSQTGKVLTHSINLVKPSLLIVGEEKTAALDDIRSQLSLPEDSYYWLADTDTRTQPLEAPTGYHNLATAIEKFPRFNPPTTQQVFYGDGLFYIYTSGTTGLPKAVIFRHGRWMKAYGTFGYIMDMKPTDVMYATLPLYHATGMVVCWACAIAGGAGFAIRRKFSAREFWNDCRQFNATAIGYVGELCRYLVDQPPSPLDRQHKVRQMIGNGMRPVIWNKFKQRFGVEEVLELYASSEGNVGFSNIFNFDNTVGFSPTPYAIVKYDREANQPIKDDNGFMIKVATGESGLLIGEITKRAPFDGYTDPAKNEACIFNNVFKEGDRYFNTGDLVRDIGFRHAQFVDRLGDTFRWRGENVSTTEVENLLSDFDAISEAIVYGVEIKDTNGRAGMAAITLAPGQSFDQAQSAALIQYCRREMPAYAIPVFLRIQQQVETTGTFKYQKNNLKTDGFNPAKTTEPLWAWLPGTDHYTPVTPELYARIEAGEFRF